jgi:ferritin-like metal-binding protein YciE
MSEPFEMQVGAVRIRGIDHLCRTLKEHQSRGEMIEQLRAAIDRDNEERRRYRNALERIIRLREQCLEHEFVDAAMKIVNEAVKVQA